MTDLVLVRCWFCSGLQQGITPQSLVDLSEAHEATYVGSCAVYNPSTGVTELKPTLEKFYLCDLHYQMWLTKKALIA